MPPFLQSRAMAALLVFSITLLAATLLSSVIARSILSETVLFLAAGLVYGALDPGRIGVDPLDPAVKELIGLALFATLFVEGRSLALPDLARAWKLPGRALLLGMPLSIAATALLARLLVGLPWLEALLLGAILAPTDPVFAAAIVSSGGVSDRLRKLLRVESGLNDGLALPLVMLLLPWSGGGGQLVILLLEVAGGVLLGIAVPWLVLRIARSGRVSVEPDAFALGALGAGALVLALSRLTGVNEFLAAFSAGMTAATMRSGALERFERLGDALAQLLKLAGLFVFGILLWNGSASGVGTAGWLFAAAVLLVVRPATLSPALLGSGLGWREWIAAVWFGPKGFASLMYAVLAFDAGTPHSAKIFHLSALVVTGSMVAHSMSAVPAGRWLARRDAGSG